jgi:cytochrome c-type biogenesis protein CcmH/NrfG
LFLVKLRHSVSMYAHLHRSVIMPVLKGNPHQRIRICIAALLTMGLTGAAAQTPSRESDQEYDRGVQLQQKGDLAGARHAYEAALKLAPRRIDALSNLGLTCAGLHQYEYAVQSFQKALEIDPKQPVVLFNLGITYLQAGHDENARRTLAGLVRGQSDNFLARHYLGVSLLKLGRIQEGVAELESVARSHPEDLDAACTLVSVYIKEAQLAKAHDLIEGFISQHDSAAAHLVTGSYRMAVQDFRQAVIEFRRAQQLNPALPELALNLGSAYAMTGSQDIAIQLFEARLRKNPSDLESLGFLGWLYLDTDRLDDAEKMLNRAHILRPDDPDILFQLGRLARRQGQFEKAAGLLERVIAAKPRDVQAHVLLATTYFRLKRSAEGTKEREIVRQLNAEEQGKRSQEAGIEPQTRARP